MSRWIETGEDEHGRYYIESLADPDGCRWLVNEVCCNADNQEMVADFPFEEDCTKEKCPYFEAEPEDPQLKIGVKSYE